MYDPDVFWGVSAVHRDACGHMVRRPLPSAFDRYELLSEVHTPAKLAGMRACLLLVEAKARAERGEGRKLMAIGGVASHWVGHVAKYRTRGNLEDTWQSKRQRCRCLPEKG